MTRTAIANALIRLARRIGRWILRKLLEIGGLYLVGYMRGKILDFRRRLKEAKSERRKRWLRGRIRRWTTAANWIDSKTSSLTLFVIEEADAAAVALPMVAAAEREAA